MFLGWVKNQQQLGAKQYVLGRVWACVHLLAVAVTFVYLVLGQGLESSNSAAQPGQQAQGQTSLRRALLEALDGYVRYQHYYRDFYGSFSRDLKSLGMPNQLPSETLESVHNAFAISVVEANPQRLLILAEATPAAPAELGVSGDRVAIDQSFRITANFTLPKPARSFLMREAQRILRLREKGNDGIIGHAASYWRFEAPGSIGERAWTAIGLKASVAGGTQSTHADDGRSPASLFNQIRNTLQGRRAGSGESITGQGTFVLGKNGIYSFLSQARFAQHVFWREMGEYANSWESLDVVTDFRFVDRVIASADVELEPIELSPDGYRLSVRGIHGDLIGERFVMDQLGQLKQVRYTDVLVEELRKSTGLFNSPLGFQIKEVPAEDDAVAKGRFLKKSNITAP